MIAKLASFVLAFSVCAPAWAEDEGLVAHYKLEQGSGLTARDSSSASHDAGIQGAKWARRDGRTALRFDGKSAYVDCGKDDRLKLDDRMTVSAWVYVTGKPSGEPVIAGADPKYWGMTHYKGRVYAYVGTSSGVRASLRDNRWLHLALTYDGTVMKLFVNGTRRASRKLAAGTKIKTGGKVLIGGANRHGAFFNGLIGDVRVYRRALSPQEVYSLSVPPGSDLATMTIGDAERRSADEFFKKSREHVEFKTSGRQLWLANRHLGIEFIKGESAFYLSRLYGIRTGRDFLKEDSARSRQGFWQLDLRRENGRDEAGRSVTSNDGAEVESQAEEAAESITLHLRWNRLAVAGEKGVLDARVSVTLKERDPLARWRIHVKNRSKTWGLRTVAFPVLKLRPIGDRPAGDRFIVSRVMGMIAKDPFGTPFPYPGWYPGGVNMQFSALYDASGSGLYLATYDGAGHRKRFHNDTLPGWNELEYKVEHDASNMGYPAEDYEMSYDFVVGPFEGDWYDACQIYRAWATRQRWCRKGPLATRKDVPRWYKECPIVLRVSSSGGDEQVLQARDDMLAMLDFIGTEMPLIWYTWKRHFPEMTHYNKEGSKWKVPDKRPYPCGNIHDGNYPILPALKTFASACEVISEAGGHVKPYVCSRIYDQGLNENAPLAAQAKPNVARNVNGDVKFVERGDVAWEMCYHTKWWQNRMKQTVTELIGREHARGIYFDTFYGGAVQCFDTRHGHAHGGGNHGYLGARKLSEAVRGAMKKADPESVMSGENPAETAIDLLDGFLYRYTIQPDGLPLFATVYGDYIVRFGTRVDMEDPGFHMQCATLFLEGAQIGRLGVYWAGHLSKEYVGTDKEKRMLFLRKLARYYRPETGAKYLAYGRLLRPIRFKTPDPMPTCSYEDTYKHNCTLTRPSLMSGTFQAPNGDIGIFIINISEKPLRFSFELTPAKYPIDARTTFRVSSMSEAGARRPAGDLQKGKVAVAGELAGHDVACFDVQAK